MQARRSNQTELLQDRILSFARGIREQAALLSPGKEKTTCCGGQGWPTPHLI